MRTITPTVAFFFFFFAWLNLLHIEVKITKLTFGENWTWCQVKTMHVFDAVKKNESLCLAFVASLKQTVNYSFLGVFRDQKM